MVGFTQLLKEIHISMVVGTGRGQSLRVEVNTKNVEMEVSGLWWEALN